MTMTMIQYCSSTHRDEMKGPKFAKICTGKQLNMLEGQLFEFNGLLFVMWAVLRRRASLMLFLNLVLAWCTASILLLKPPEQATW